MISSVCKHSLIAHTAQLLGQGAAIEIEVVCELLAVEGNIELIPALPCSLAGKISQQPAAHIFGRRTENTGRQRQIFLRAKQKNALHQLAVPAFSCIVSVKQGEQAEKKNFAVLRRNGIHHKRFTAERISLRKHASGFDAAQNTVCSPEIAAFNVHTA